MKETSCIKSNLDRLGINDAETRQKWLKRGLKYYPEPSKADKKYAQRYAVDAYYYDLTLIEQYYDGTTKKNISNIKSRCGY